MSDLCCVCQRSFSEGEILVLTPDEAVGGSADTVGYCAPCLRIMRDRESGAQLLKGLYEMRLREAGVQNAKGLAEKFYAKLKQATTKKMH